MVLLDNILGKKQATPNQTTQSTISADEDAKIKNWINQKYQGQSEAIKTAAYKDAYNAVVKRKAENIEKTNNEIKRQLNAQTASYVGNDKVKKEQAKLAKAEMAVSDAADIIRQGQLANGQKVNPKLTDKQLVDSFLLANNGKPFAEYVSKYLNGNISGNSDYNNLWLASKLGLDTGSTLGVKNSTIINAKDKLAAGTRGFGQGLVNLTQNTIGTFANAVGSNVGAGLGEIGYALANAFGADTSEGSVWDKLKKAEGYSWSEARDAANSKLGEGVLSEDRGAYDIGEGLGETAAEVALTAPLEFGVGSAIQAGKIGKTALDLSKAGKFGLQALNAAGAGVGFQLADDAARGELSGLDDYLTSAVISAGTAGVGNLIGKAVKKGSSNFNKLKRIALGPNERVENALLKKTPAEYNHIDDVNSTYAKDPNAAVNPLTELAKPLKQAEEILDIDRLNKGNKLQEVRQNLKYIGKDRSTGSIYTRKDVVNDLNAALRNLADEKKYGKAHKKIDQIPQFEIKKGKLELSDNSIEELNKFELVGVNGKEKDVKLGDEIMKLYNRVYSMGAKDNAANTHYFIEELKNLYGQKWDGGEPNVLREVINSLSSIETKFNNSLTSKSLKDLQEYSKLDEAAIKLSNNFKKLIGAMDKGSIDDVKAAVKALKGNQTTEQLFREIQDATEGVVDMNNEVLAWAYNLSLHDVKKAQDLLSTFYPSKAGAIETVLQQLSKEWRKSVAKDIVESGTSTKKLGENISTDRLNTVFAQIANIINANDKE